MFNDIREQRKNIFTYILVGLAGVGMLFLGVPLLTQNNSQQYVLKVNEAEVALTALKAQVSRLQSQFPDMDAKVIEQQALSQLVSQSLLDQHALTSGYTFSKPALFELVKQQYGNDEAYQAALSQMRTTAAAYEAAIAQQQTVQNYYRFLANSSLSQRAIFEQFLRATSQTRDVTLMRLPLDSAIASIELDEKDINDYYQAHQTQYQTPELVDVEYVILNAATIPSDKAFSEEDIDTAHQRAMRENTKRSGQYIIFDQDTQAQDALQALQDGNQSFADVFSAVERGDISGEAGELALGSHGSGPSMTVDDALFALQEVGDVSSMLTTDYGPMLVSLTEIQADSVPSREQTLANMRRKAGEEEYYDRAARAFDAALANKPFSQIVDITGAPIQTLTQVGMQDTQPEWLQNSAIKAQLFGENAIAVDKIGEPVELNNQRSVFYRVVHRVEPSVRAFADVSTQVEQDARVAKANDLLKSKSQELAQAMRDGDDMDALANDYQASIESLNDIGLFKSTDVEQALIRTLFNQSERVQVINADNGDWLVSYLKAVHDGELEAIPAQVRQSLQREWQQNSNLEVQNSYSRWLRERAQVTVYEENLPSQNL